MSRLRRQPQPKQEHPEEWTDVPAVDMSDQHRDQQYDLAGALMAFEDGEMDEADFFRLFQHLIDTGMAWTLQGGYWRTAMRLIDDGLCHEPEEES